MHSQLIGRFNANCAGKQSYQASGGARAKPSKGTRPAKLRAIKTEPKFTSAASMQVVSDNKKKEEKWKF